MTRSTLSDLLLKMLKAAASLAFEMRQPATGYLVECAIAQLTVDTGMQPGAEPLTYTEG